MAWLPGYTYRKKGSVVATAAGVQVNYQVKLLVGESSGAVGEDVDCESHCLDFPNDIRFTDTDGTTKHDYWVESITGVTPNRLATIWIEVATIPASGSVDFYMYYRKASDSGESVGDDTFELFDDFLGSSLDGTKWTEVLKGSGTSIVVANSECKLNVPDDQISSASIQSIKTFTNGIAVHVKRKCPDDIEYIEFSIGSGNVRGYSGGQSEWWYTLLDSGYFWYITMYGDDPSANEIYESPPASTVVALTNANVSFSNHELNKYNIHQYSYDSAGKLKWSLTNIDVRPIGEGFEKYASNPLNIPCYSTIGPVHPCMLYFPSSEDGYKYWLFYETVSTGGINEYLDLVRSNDGINFVDTGVSNHILSPSSGGNWDDKYIADSSIVKVDSMWYMYYCGVDSTLKHRIGLATSSNGKTWTRITDGIDGTSKVLVPNTGLTEEAGDKFVSPSVYYDGTKFWMWYVSKKAGNEYCMCLAESTDGKSWTKYGSNPVYEASGETIWHINVTKYDGSYYCYFCHGSTGHLRLLNSTNKTTWALASNDPVLEYEEAWEGTHIYESGPAADENGDVVLIDGKMWMYYSTRGGTGLYYEIGLAKSWENIDLGEVRSLTEATDTTFLSTNKKILITQGAYSIAGRGKPTYLDWLFVHKYTSPEPTWGTWSGEETTGRTRSYAFIIG